MERALQEEIAAYSRPGQLRFLFSHLIIDGYEALVKLLLDRGDVEADSKDKGGRTAMLQATENGHETVAKLLVDRADIEADSKDKNGQTPLWWAASKAHEAVVKLLLDRHDVEADSKDKDGRTPRSWVAESEYEAVVNCWSRWTTSRRIRKVSSA